MAKDDYDVIVCHILVYLYKWLKKKTRIAPEQYLQPLTDEIPIDEEYFSYVLEHMTEDKLIENIKFSYAWGGDVVNVDISKARITPDGIHYLKDNSTMQKIARSIPGAASIAALFM